MATFNNSPISLLSLSAEEIGFQNKNFGTALESLFDEMLGKRLEDSEADEQYANKIAKIVLDNTGLMIKVVLSNGDDGDDSWSEPAMFMSNLSNGHIFYQHSGDQIYNKVSEYDANKLLDMVKNGVAGTFNYKTGKITGLLNKKVCGILYFRWNIIKWIDLNAGEIAALIMHEIGHESNAFEYIAHAATANMVLGALLKTVANDPIETRKVVFKKAADIIGDVDFADLETVTDTKVVTSIVIDAYYDKKISLNGTSCYDNVTAEQAADQYCSRMGYGKQLASAVYKGQHMSSSKKYDFNKSKAKRLSMRVAEIAKFAVLGLTQVALLSSPLATVYKLIAMVGTQVIIQRLCSREHEKLNQPQIYDTVRVRLMRLREDSVIYLKNCNLPKQDVIDRLKDIEEMDKLIKEYLPTDYKPLFQVINEFLFKKDRDTKNIRDLQRKLEELSANDLFLQSAKLRTLGSEGIVDYVKGMFKGKKPKDTLAQKLDYVKGHQNFKDRKIEITKSVFGNVSNEQELLQFVKEYSDFVNCLPEIHKKISQTTIELAEYYVKCAKEMDSTNKPIDLNRIKLAKKQILTKVFGSPSSNKYLPKQIGSDYSYTTTSDGVRLNIGLTQASAWYGELKGPTKLSVSAGILYRIQEYLETIIQKGIECEQLAEEDSYDYKGEERYYISTKFDEVVCDRLYANWNGEDFRNECIEFYKDLNESLRTDILKVNDVILNNIMGIID